MTDTATEEVGPSGETPEAQTTEAISAPTPDGTNTVPAGYTIDYFVHPKRKYEIVSPQAYFPDSGEGPTETRVEVPSVTTILECLDKPALPWWGMKVGALGTLTLIYEHGYDIAGWIKASAAQGATPETMVDHIVKLLSEHKLTVNHVRDSAAVRGVTAHDAFEAWCAIGQVPEPDEFPEHERGYVRGLCAFIADTHGGFHPTDQEVMVGSREHGFAGRYDMRAKTDKDMRLVHSAYTTSYEIRKRGPKYTNLPAGTSLLCDLKTSKGVYNTHLLQLEGYEGASVECGYEPTDARAVLHITRDGLYEFKRARASYDDFLAILHTYHALQRVNDALK